MITQIFPSRYTPIKTPVSVSALAWQRISPVSSCLITGLQNGSVGVTWYPIPPITANPQSLTLSLNLGAVTHISCSSTHAYSAIADRSGAVMLLDIKPPPKVDTRLLTPPNYTQNTTVGLNWSHDGNRLACLGASSQRGHPLTLYVYSSLSQSQITHAKVCYPRHLVGQGLLHRERETPSQRLAWSHDDSSIFITVPYHLVIEVSTQGLHWVITSTYVLFYSTQISFFAPRHLLVTDTNQCLTLFHTSFTAAKELKSDVEHYSVYPEHGLLLVATNTAIEGRRLSVLSLKEGHEVINYKLPIKNHVTSLSLSPDMNVLVYATTAEVGSLVLYRTVPTLSQLCMTAVKENRIDMTRLPRLFQKQTNIHHTVLCYPGEFSEEIDLFAYKLEKKGVLGNQNTFVIQKHQLGYNLEIARLSQSMGRSMKLSRQRASRNEDINIMLNNLLDPTLAKPPTDTKIKWNRAMTKFSLRCGGKKIRLRFKKEMSIIIEQEHQDMSVIPGDRTIDLSLSGEKLGVIREDRNFFSIKLYKRATVSYLQGLLIVIAYITRNFVK